ncbi:unnamed protein product, partial [Onchocerca ochengi]
LIKKMKRNHEKRSFECNNVCRSSN